MTREKLDAIKKFAEENFNREESDPRYIYVETEEFNVTNPWIDKSGRFELNDVNAVNEWGLEVVVSFIEKAKESLKGHICKWRNEDGECELRCGIADDPSCEGTAEDRWWCAYCDDYENAG